MSRSQMLRCVKHQNVDRKEALSIWGKILSIAVVSNEYHETLRTQVLHLVEEGDYAGLLVLGESLSREVHATPKNHFLAHQLSSLIRKYPDFPNLGIDPQHAAMKVFESSEWRCKWVNRRLSAVMHRDVQPHDRERREAQKWIRYVLTDRSQKDPEGPVCDFPFQELWNRCDFTGGASIGVNGNSTHINAKLMQSVKGGWTVNPRALRYAARAMWENAHTREFVLHEEGRSVHCLDANVFIKRFLARVSIVGYNKLSFVPKTASIHRVACPESTLGTFLLKGVDEILRDRLRRVGLDLKDQVLNQQLAFKGSTEWETDNPYCTIDLSSASDTLSIGCAFDLLPEEWFKVLDDLRSHYRLDGDKVVRYEKFVTMGNGSCFPLQTMIFSSLCVAAYASIGQKPDFRVYGDDIIVRRAVFDKVIELLKFYGFVPNPRKTFSEGPFRESCGADYHGGTNVRPIIFDKPLEHLQQVFGFHNQTLRSPCPYVFAYFDKVRDFLFHYVNEEIRYVSDSDPLYTFSGETVDGAFWVALDVALASRFTKWNPDTQSLSYIRLQAMPVVDQTVQKNTSLYGLSVLIAALRGGSSSSTFSQRYRTTYRPRIVNPLRDYGGPKKGRPKFNGIAL